MSMNEVFLDDTEIIRTTNDEFVQIDRNDLLGNYDLRLTVATAESDNAKASELAFLLQTLGNTQDATLTNMVLGEIADLRKMPTLAEKLRTFKPTPDPLEQEAKKLEIELLKVKIGYEKARIANLGTDSMLDQAKANTEAAKAEYLSNDAHNKAQDFVSKQDGTSHRQQMERIRAQSEAQARLKEVEHGLNETSKNNDLMRNVKPNPKN